MHFVKLTVENGIFSGTSREEEVDLDHMHWMLAQDTWNSKQRQYILYCITVARSITVRRSSTDDHGCSASTMLAMVSSLPRVPSSFCLLFALRWLRNTRKSVARTKQCCLLSQERNLQSQSVFVFSQSEIYRNLLFVKKQWEFCNFGLCEPHGERPCDLLTWTLRGVVNQVNSEKRDVVMLKIVKDC